jgi:hypothetical protein
MGKAAADVVEAAREHTVDAIERLAALMQQDDDRDVALSAATALLDRGWGKPAQAILAQVGGTSEPVRYEFYWADAKTNTLPEKAPTIDATTSGDAEEGGGPVIVWGGERSSG